MNEKLKSLADKLGILTEYYDAGQDHKRYETDEETIRFFAEKLGYRADTDKEIEHSLVKFENRRWQETLEPVYVTEQGNLNFDIVLPVSQKDGIVSVSAVSRQNGQTLNIASHITASEEREINRKHYIRHTCTIDTALEVGYYDLSVVVDDKTYKSVLAVAPTRCYENTAVDNGRLWGYALQLYSLKSRRNWGVGDFTDLKNFVDVCADSGGDIIGLNPLNILEHNYPENASPYLSVSRLFLNPIYIDIENVPEFKAEDLSGIEGDIEDFRNAEIIQYEKIYPLKIKFMEKLYERFLNENNPERQKEFAAFCEREGAELNKLAVFLTLYEERCRTVWGGWRAWEGEYRNPYNPAVKKYAETHEHRVNFYKFLQFEAFRQFDLAAAEVGRRNLKIGFYRDLAVGVGQDSAELWSDPDVFIAGSGAGAPPDAFFPGGQKWGLGAFNPFVLKAKAYEPLIKIMRANMRNTGALRIDHVMSLMRLYVIPNDKTLGTYIMYNFSDMLNIVAIESHLNKCVVAGESLGNVPDGFLEALERKNIYSLSVLWSERAAGWGGDFNQPSAYQEKSFTSVGTHDMAPLKMWWFGYDIADSRKAEIIPNDEVMNNNYHEREMDRWKLLSALDQSGLWPQDRPRQNNYIYGEAYPEGMAEAVNAFVASCPSRVFLAELENILEVDKRQNLPGVDRDKHPNWRRKIPVDIEDLAGNEMFIRNINAIRRVRG